jgi:hypothetical protein
LELEFLFHSSVSAKQEDSMESALVMPRSLDLLCRRRARQSAAPHPSAAAFGWLDETVANMFGSNRPKAAWDGGLFIALRRQLSPFV